MGLLGRLDAAHIEFDLAGQFDNRFRMAAVLEKRVLQRLGAADEQAAVEAVLLLDNPVAMAVSADEDDGGYSAAPARFDEFHGGIPSGDDVAS